MHRYGRSRLANACSRPGLPRAAIESPLRKYESSLDSVGLVPRRSSDARQK